MILFSGTYAQTNTTLTLSITFETSAYDTAGVASFDFDNTTFVDSVATSMGVDPSEVTVSTDGTSDVDIEVTLIDESTATDPVNQDLIDNMAYINASVAEISSTVASEVGLEDTDIESTSLDLCGTRDCNGLGTCDPQSGVCDCDSADFWGIDCDIPVDCNDGEKDVDSAYCNCDYPEHGQRCQNTVDCSC